jgi:hypothetical protein
MSACALRRWGTGTACERPADTPAAKEMAARLAAMQAERSAQDARWSGPVPTEAALQQQIATPTKKDGTTTQRPHMR